MYIPDVLYSDICKVIPIPCVDIFIHDPHGRVLLLKRKNEPMRGRWWFPRERVFFTETRRLAVTRIMKMECNLSPQLIIERGTFDLLLEIPASEFPRHAITTLFQVSIENGDALTIVEQSSEAKFQLPSKWMDRNLHEFIASHIFDGPVLG